MLRVFLAAVLLLAATAARADYDAKIVGSWMVSAKEDRFGDGGTFTAFVTDGGRTAFGPRCIQKELSLGIVDLGGAQGSLIVGDRFEVKLRVDKNPAVATFGIAITDRVIQLDTSKDLVKTMLTGKETALRLEKLGVSQTMVFKMTQTAKALADILRECPLT